MTYPVISRRGSRENWEDWDTIRDWLAEDLKKGRLGLVLGAGASIGFGLPDWLSLVKGAYKHAAVPWPRGHLAINPEEAADALLEKHLKGDDVRFAQLIRSTLYQALPSQLEVSYFANNHLLLALCALIAASERGQVRNIISYNFDDLVEEYLRIQGLVVRSLVKLPSWDGRLDIEVLHPHGLLSLREDIPSTRIVFASRHFEEFHGETGSMIRARLIDVLSSSTMLFIGVSGRDSRLLEDLRTVREVHPAGSSNYLFWAVRFSDDATDPLRGEWEKCGVVQVTVQPGYKDLPKKLFEICRHAVGSGRRS